MKEQYFGNTSRLKQKGSSTLEILIAFSILALCMTAVIMVGFGNQAVSVDAQTNIEGLSYAQSVLEIARAQAKNDFNSVVSANSTVTLGIPYTQSLAVTDLTQCKKQATSTVTWTSGKRQQTISLSTFFTDVAGVLALGGDCTVEPPIGGWTNPNSLMSRDFQKIVGDNAAVNSSAGIPSTDLDIYNGKAYLTAIASTKHNFYIFDISNVLSGTLPPIVGSFNTGPGLNRVDVAGTYAYVANASTTNTQSSDEFMVIDVSNPIAPTTVASIDLGIIPNCPTFCPGGAQSIYYYNGRVYVGTHRINGAEFYIFSVTAPYSPTNPHLLGSKNLDHNVNDIVVSGNYAYLATSDDSGELTKLDISNPALIPAGTKYDASGSEDGLVVYVVGTKAYLGRERTPSAREDFHIVDTATMTLLGSKNLGLHTNKSVTGIRVASRYAFVASDDSNPGFYVFDISNPASITSVSSFNYANDNSSVDYEDGFIYTSNTQNDVFRIIRPAECADKVDDDGDSKIDTLDPQCHTDGNTSNASSYNVEDDNE